MSKKTEDTLRKIPLVNWVVGMLDRIKLPGMGGLSLYHLLEMYVIGIVRGALSSRASAIAFSLFMAIFPLLIFLVTLLPFVIPYVSVGGGDFDVQFLAFLEEFMPTATGDYFAEIYYQIKDQKRGGLLSSAFLISIFLMTNGVNSIFSGFEYSYHVELTRSFFGQYLYALLVGIMLSVLLIIGAVVFVYFDFYFVTGLDNFVGDVTGVGDRQTISPAAKLVKYLFFVFLAYLITAILYYFGTAEGKEARFFSIGALMTTILFLLTSYLFSVYVDEFARYNELYGALGGLLMFLVYIWLNSNILLLGFELNVTLSSLRKKGNQKLAE